MGILGFLLGAVAVKQVTDYPPEIKKFSRQIPRSEREAVMQHYKELPGNAKADFKQALRKADVDAASQILGQDLSQYNLQLKKEAAAKEAAAPSGAQSPLVESDIVARINKILSEPSSIDPVLVAEAAKRYQAALGTGEMTITEKTKKLLEVSS
ncbi:MAG TPA: hypothetical protein PKA10_19570 [Selenomonadales bacterium]|nr:hypothetical protein [Selenomonadales bacterium]